MIQRWTPEADAELAELYKTLSAGEIARRMGRTRCSIKGRLNVIGLKKPEGITNSGRFMPGQASWNKGKHYQAGGRSAETRFKPGCRHGIALARYLPVGSERVTKDGYIQRKVSDEPTFYKRWRFVHVLTWEAAHGPVPKGHVVSFKNGDGADCRRVENLELLHRRELMARNTVHNYPEELRQVIRLKGAITKRIATRTRKEQQP
jgi:hypothetical protein